MGARLVGSILYLVHVLTLDLNRNPNPLSNKIKSKILWEQD